MSLFTLIAEVAVAAMMVVPLWQAFTAKHKGAPSQIAPSLEDEPVA